MTLNPAFAVTQEPDERLRVTLPSSTVVGSFVEVRQGELVLQDEGGTRAIALDAIRRIERHVERRPYAKGVLIGAGSGVAVAGCLASLTLSFTRTIGCSVARRHLGLWRAPLRSSVRVSA